jgi:glycosyltransferase involved in cell wall biosynthesis
MGGSELMLWHLFRAAAAAEISLNAVFLADGPMVNECRELGIKTQMLQAGRVRHVHRYIATIRKIARISQWHHASLILSWLAKGQLYGGAAAALIGLPSAWYQASTPSPNSWMDRLATLMPAASVITVSSAGAAAQARLIPARRVDLIYPGVDMKIFDPERLPSAQTMRLRLGLPPEGPVIGIVGRLQSWKGMHVIIEALPTVLVRFPSATCVVVGGRHDLEPDYPEFLQQTVRRLNVSSQVFFVGHQTNVEDWMQAMDIVVHASDNEPFGIVVIEAMALGKPVVAGADGGPTEIITNGADGLLVPYGDVQGVASAVLRLLEDPEASKRMGQRARTRARDFSSDEYVERFIRLLKELIR